MYRFIEVYVEFTENIIEIINISMSNKPMTDYLNHKYPDNAVTEIPSILDHVNTLLKRIIVIETSTTDMKAELDNMGEYLCNTSTCKKRYKGVKGMDGDR